MAVDFGTGYIDVKPQIDKSAAQSSMQRDLGSTLSSVGSRMTSVGSSMTAGLTLPIVGFGIAAVKAFSESSEVASQTKAALESTGGAAGVTADEVRGLATEISNYAAVDDEAVQAGENMLLTFTNIRNEAGKGNDIFTQATKTLADLSRRTGQDMPSAAVQLGKALNDPIKGMASLGRVGVQFSASQSKAITKLVESGDIMGAQKIILRELAIEFGGSARAYGQSAAGEVAKGSIAMGNALEDLGGTIMEVAGPIISALASGLETAIGFFKSLPGPVQAGVIIFAALLAAVGPLLIIFGSIATALGALAPLFTVTAVAEGGATVATWGLNTALLATMLTVGLIVVAVVALAVIIIKNWDTIKNVVLAVWNAIKTAALFVWNLIKTALTPVFIYYRMVFNVIKAVVLGVWKVILGAAKIVWALVYQYVRIFFVLFKAIWNAIKPIVLPVWNAIKSAAGAVWGAIKGIWNGAVSFFRGVFSTIKDVATGIWEGVKNTIINVFDSIVGAIAGPVNVAIRGVNTLINAFNRLPGSDIGTIPELARGGIITGPTLALVGERGREAVIPLNRMDEFGFGSRGGVITGVLTLTPDSTALIRGIAADEDEVGARREQTRARMARRQS